MTRQMAGDINNGSRQLSAIRRLDQRPFHFLAGVLVAKNFDIIRAALVPIAVVEAHAVFVAHTNSWSFLLRDEIWDRKGVRDVTHALIAAAEDLGRGLPSSRND